jgi:uncharacterized protein YidB (DUF937 family)
VPAAHAAISPAGISCECDKWYDVTNPSWADYIRRSRSLFQEEIVSGIFGDLISSVLKGMSGQQGQASGLGAILAQVLGNTDLGSVGGLLQQLQKSGLGPQVASWLGNGANLPISVDQLRAALGDEHVRQLAASFGIPVDQLLGQLSQHLPAAVDQMSPNGTLEQQIGP